MSLDTLEEVQKEFEAQGYKDLKVFWTEGAEKLPRAYVEKTLVDSVARILRGEYEASRFDDTHLVV